MENVYFCDSGFSPSLNGFQFLVQSPTRPRVYVWRIYNLSWTIINDLFSLFRFFYFLCPYTRFFFELQIFSRFRLSDGTEFLDNGNHRRFLSTRVSIHGSLLLCLSQTPVVSVRQGPLTTLWTLSLNKRICDCYDFL